MELALLAHPRAWMVVLLALALAIRALVCLMFGDIDPSTANIWEQGGIAAEWVEHGRMVGVATLPNGEAYRFPTAFMPPLYIFVWGGLFALFGKSGLALGAALAINAVCGAAIAGMTARVAERLFSSALVALLAGLWIAVHPVFVFSSATYHGVNIYLALFLWLFLLVTSPQPASLGRAILTGVALGVGVLARTEYIILGGVVVLAGYFIHRNWRTTLLALVVGAVVVIPWTIRNFVVLDSFIPVANTTGYNLFKGFNPEANGSGDWVDNQHLAERQFGDKLRSVPLTPHYETDRDRVYGEAATAFIADQPVRAFLELPLLKLALFWFFDIHDPITHSWLYQLALWTLIIPSAAGILLVGKLLWRDPVHRVVLAVFLAQSLVMMAYAVHVRYRMNVEPFLMAYGAYAIWRLTESRRPVG